MGLVRRVPGPVSRVTSQLCQGDPGQVCVGTRDSFPGCAQVVQVCLGGRGGGGGGDPGVRWGTWSPGEVEICVAPAVV